MSRFSVKCFGVGDGWPCADRHHAAFLYRFGDASFLVDCGEPIGDSLVRCHVKPDAIDRIFLSHLHSDHVGGIFMLLQGLWLRRRKKPLPIHMPAEGIRPVSEMLKAGYLFPELFPFRLGFNPLQAGKSVAIKGVRVRAYPTTHLENLKRRFGRKHRQEFEAFSFLFETGRRRVGHSADLGRPHDLEPLLEQPLDLLVCELAHFTAEELFGYLRGRKVRLAIFVHLSDRYWKQMSKLRRLAAKMLPGMECRFARDEQQIDF